MKITPTHRHENLGEVEYVEEDKHRDGACLVIPADPDHDHHGFEICVTKNLLTKINDNHD